MKLTHGPVLTKCSLPGNQVAALAAALRLRNPDYDPEEAAANDEGENVIPEHVEFFDEETRSIPTGLIFYVTQWAENRGMEVERCGFPSTLPFPPKVDPGVIPGITLREYQVSAIATALQLQCGILEIATGGGKSEIAIGITLVLGKPRTLYVVPNQAAMYQTHKRFIQRGFKDEEVGRLGDNLFEIDRPVVIAVINSLYSAIKREDEQVLSVMQDAELFFVDECVSGDSIIITEKGKVKIRDFREKDCKYALSWDGQRAVFKEVDGWYAQGIKKIVLVRFNQGEIECTRDHLFLTRRGWVAAGDLRKGESVLHTASADAVARSQLLMQEGELEDTALGTLQKVKFAVENIRLGINRLVYRRWKSIVHCVMQRLFVCVGVVKKLGWRLRRLSGLSKIGVVESTGITSTVTINVLLRIPMYLLRLKGKLFSGRCWGIFLSPTQTIAVKRLDCMETTEVLNANGVGIKRRYWKTWAQRLGHVLTQVMVTGGSRLGLPACLACMNFILLRIYRVRNYLISSGLTLWALLGWRGGFVTMAPGLEQEFICIQRDLSCRNKTSYQHGLKKLMGLRRLYIKPGITFVCTYLKHYLSEFFQWCVLTFRRSYNTNWVQVVCVSDAGQDEVFDLSIKDTYCFFANGALVHNCHHQGTAVSWQVVALQCPAQYRFGLSGTPYKDDMSRFNPHYLHAHDSWLTGLIGNTLVYVSASKLQEQGDLAKVEVISFPSGGAAIQQMPCQTAWQRRVQWAKNYKEGIIQNDVRNGRIVCLACNLVDMGRTPIVSVKNKAHGRHLQLLLAKQNVSAVCSYGSGVTIIPKVLCEELQWDYKEIPLWNKEMTPKLTKERKRTRAQIEVLEQDIADKPTAQKKKRLATLKKKLKNGPKKVGHDQEFVEAACVVDVEWLVQEGYIEVLIGNVIYDESQDLPVLTDLINAAGGNKQQRYRQKVGRVLRLHTGKDIARVWEPYDDCCPTLLRHTTERLTTAAAQGFPVVTDNDFAKTMCTLRLKSLPIGEVKVKTTELEVTIDLTIPVGEAKSYMFVKPRVTLRAELEDGDDLDVCSKQLHAECKAVFVQEAKRQATTLKEIISLGFGSSDYLAYFERTSD